MQHLQQLPPREQDVLLSDVGEELMDAVGRVGAALRHQHAATTTAAVHVRIHLIAFFNKTADYSLH